MNKSTLIAYMESTTNPKNTDQFVRAIFESSPDIMELDAKTPEGGVYDISEKNIDGKSNKKESQSDKDNENEVGPVKRDDNNEVSSIEAETNKESKSLDIKADAGYKQVAYDDAFRNITDDTYPAISEMFSMDVIKQISESKDSDWKEVDRRMIMCNEDDYNSSKVKMNCYNSSNPTGLGRPTQLNRKYIDKYYTPKQVGKLKDVRDRYIMFTVSDLGEYIEILDISPKKNGVTYAIKSKLTSEKNPYLMKGSNLHNKFLFKELSND